MDDIIVLSKMLEDHLLEQVFEKVKESVMKLSLEKCNFCQEEVKYLDHVVSADGVQTDPEKTKNIKN